MKGPIGGDENQFLELPWPMASSLKISAMYEKGPQCERSDYHLKIRDVRIRDGRKRDERDLPVLPYIFVFIGSNSFQAELVLNK